MRKKKPRLRSCASSVHKDIDHKIGFICIKRGQVRVIMKAVIYYSFHFHKFMFLRDSTYSADTKKGHSSMAHIQYVEISNFKGYIYTRALQTVWFLHRFKMLFLDF